MSYYYYTSLGTTPGTDVLLVTTAYTVLCIIVGFLFKCRKKKWRNNEENAGAAKLDDQNASEPWMDNPYMCGVDAVIGEHSLFDHDIDTSLNNSFDTDADGKTYEYWEHMFGLVDDGKDSNANAEGESKTSYKLYEDETGNADKNLNVEGDPNDTMIENPPDPIIAPITTISETTDESPQSANVNDFFENYNKVKLRSKQLKNLRGRDKSYEIRRVTSGRRRWSPRVKKTENKSVQEVQVDDKKTGSPRSFNLFHKPNSLEIELNAKNVDGSYEHFDDHEDPINVEKLADPDLNHTSSRLTTSSSKDASKSEDIVDRSGEGDDTYKKEMKEIYKLAVP